MEAPTTERPTDKATELRGAIEGYAEAAYEKGWRDGATGVSTIDTQEIDAAIARIEAMLGRRSN